MMGLLVHQLYHMQTICTSLQTDSHTPHHSIFTDRMLFLTTNQQRQSTEGTQQALMQVQNILQTSSVGSQTS